MEISSQKNYYYILKYFYGLKSLNIIYVSDFQIKLPRNIDLLFCEVFQNIKTLFKINLKKTTLYYSIF